MFVLKVNKSVIRVLESETIYGDSRNIYSVVLLFNEDWNGLSKVITFDNGTKTKPVIADATRTIVTTSIPWELLTYPGTIRVSVAGAKNNLVVLPSQICVLGKVHKGSTVEYPPDVNDPSVTPTVVDQLLTEIAKKGDTIELQDGVLYLKSDGKIISQTEIQNGSDNIVSSLDNETISDKSFFEADTNQTYALKNVTIEYIDQNNEPGSMLFNDDIVQVVTDDHSLAIYKIDGTIAKFSFSDDDALILGSVDHPTTGSDGASAYEVAVENGFVGTEQEWLDSLKGAPGKDGESAYELAVENGYTGTLEEWLDSLKGKPGSKGSKGDPGESAYQLALDSGFTGTEEEWLASLKGEPGKSAYEIAVENGFDGTEEEWIDSIGGGSSGEVTDAITSTDVDRIQILTQEEADNIQNKSPKTMYLIKG